MNTRKSSSTSGTRRIVIDPKAKEIWSEIENDVEKIDERNCLCLNYKSPTELVLIGSGSGGIEEILRMKLLKEEKISFCLIFGCQKRGKNQLDKVRVVFLWIPESIAPLKRARAILDVDEIVDQLDMSFFCLLGSKKLQDITTSKMILQVSEIRGGVVANPGRYYFDENVSRLRMENLQKKSQQKIQDVETYHQKVDEFRRKETHVLRELLTTERHYIKCLLILLEMYVNPIGTYGHHKEHSFVAKFVNGIINVNLEYFESLQKIYCLSSNICNSEDVTFKRAIDRLDESFFTKSKISEIVDASLIQFGKFSYYSAFVCHYSKMFNMVNSLFKKDRKMEAHFNQMSKDLKKRGERNCEFASYLIMPVQRIPRYTLLFRELLKYTPELEVSSSTSVRHNNYNKIKRTLEEVKKLANVVNENKDGMMRVLKTIQLSQDLGDTSLLQEKMVKYKTIHILNNTSSSTRKMLFLTKDSSSSTTQGKEGEICVFEKLLIVVELRRKKKKKKTKTHKFLTALKKPKKQRKSWVERELFGYEQEETEHILKLFCRIAFKNNPNVRCYRHPQIREVLTIEEEDRKISLRCSNADRCEDIVQSVQQQISRYHTHRAMSRLYATRVLFRSPLKTKKFGGGKVKSKNSKNNNNPSGGGGGGNSSFFSFVICADMKMKAFELYHEIGKEPRMFKSYSLIGAQYGLTTYSKTFETTEDDNLKSYGNSKNTSSSSSSSSRRAGGLFASVASPMNYSASAQSAAGVYEVGSHVGSIFNSTDKEDKNRNWFYISFRMNSSSSSSSPSKKKKKKKNKKNKNQEEEVEGEDDDDDDDNNNNNFVIRKQTTAATGSASIPQGGAEMKKEFFRADDVVVLDIWMGLLDLIGCCTRKDEKEEFIDTVGGEEEMVPKFEATPSFLRDSQNVSEEVLQKQGIPKEEEKKEEEKNHQIERTKTMMITTTTTTSATATTEDNYNYVNVNLEMNPSRSLDQMSNTTATRTANNNSNNVIIDDTTRSRSLGHYRRARRARRRVWRPVTRRRRRVWRRRRGIVGRGQGVGRPAVRTVRPAARRMRGRGMRRRRRTLGYRGRGRRRRRRRVRVGRGNIGERGRSFGGSSAPLTTGDRGRIERNHSAFY